MANEEGTLAATTHLIERGCRRIVWVSQAGTANETSNAVWLRGEGYRKALRRAQLELDPALQLHLDALTMAKGARAVRTLLDDGRSFDGVVAVTDTVAFGVLRGLADRGRRSPTTSGSSASTTSSKPSSTCLRSRPSRPTTTGWSTRRSTCSWRGSRGVRGRPQSSPRPSTSHHESRHDDVVAGHRQGLRPLRAAGTARRAASRHRSTLVSRVPLESQYPEVSLDVLRRES